MSEYSHPGVFADANQRLIQIAVESAAPNASITDFTCGKDSSHRVDPGHERERAGEVQVGAECKLNRLVDAVEECSL